jgi:PQQ-dependent dehydrogenase (s-GDH family)
VKNKHLLLILSLFAAQFLAAQTTPNFTMRQVKCGMEMPWEITYGPDNAIWATESRGYRVSRINPQTGVSTVILDLSNNKNFPNYPSVSPQGGLMGLALHPNLLSGKPYVYLAYAYRYDGGAEPTGYFFKTKVVRYTYNANAQTLTNEEVMCDTIPGSSDHNGGRMTIANVGGAPYLFYGVGDMGGGQFANANRPNKAQDPTSYEGKILRFNIEPDADPNALDKWIPNDGNNTFGRAVYSIGHRNPQGLVAGLNGNLYQAEHGPYSDDELNLINGTGRNYGHPLVVGAADGNYNGAGVGAGTGVPQIVNEVANATSLGANYRNPMKSFFPVANATIRENYLNAVNNTPPVPNYFLSWNSIAPSGIDFYNSTAIPNWQNSILITSLKRRRVYRLQLDAAGTAVISDTIPLFADMGRFRDVCISPDGTKIYVSCDSEGQTSGPTAGTTIDPPNKGCILEFTYAPVVVTCAFNNCPTNQTLTLNSGTTIAANWTAPTLSNCNAKYDCIKQLRIGRGIFGRHNNCNLYRHKWWGNGGNLQLYHHCQSRSKWRILCLKIGCSVE